VSDGKIIFNEASPPHTFQGDMEVSSQTVNTVNACPRDGLILIQHQKEGFTQAIQHGYEPAATEMDCLRAAQVIEAMIKSASTGTTV
jgi:predicted dehydrogenase